jgi:hypothetical protein
VFHARRRPLLPRFCPCGDDGDEIIEIGWPTDVCRVRHVAQVTFHRFDSRERDIAAEGAAAHIARVAAPLREQLNTSGVVPDGIDMHCLAACRPHQGT